MAVKIIYRIIVNELCTVRTFVRTFFAVQRIQDWDLDIPVHIMPGWFLKQTQTK